MKPLLVLELTIEGKKHSLEYSTMGELLLDSGLKALFEGGYVEACTVFSGGRRVAGLPFMEWERLKEAVTTNSTFILRNMELPA